MTKQLKFICLLLLMASVTFAQQPNRSNTNISQKKVITDTLKKKVPNNEAQATIGGGEPCTYKCPSCNLTFVCHHNIHNSRACLKKNSNKLISNDSINRLSKKSVATNVQARTGQVNPPINGVGVVVKKNRPKGAHRVIPATNEKGETEVTITEMGDYTFILNTGGGAASSNNDVAAKSQGGPVRGVKVALGHNPPGYCCEKGMSCCARGVTNNNGEVVFKNLEVGSYTLLVQAPCPFGHEWKDGKCVQVGDKTNNPIKQN